nr:hypothetical protein [Marinicella sp. W31]MDC2878115.1 hypothetical protein [Marinicella sp. W31]
MAAKNLTNSTSGRNIVAAIGCMLIYSALFEGNCLIFSALILKGHAITDICRKAWSLHYE